MEDDTFGENGDRGEDAVIRLEYTSGGFEVAASINETGQDLEGATIGAVADLSGVTLVAAWQDEFVGGGETVGISASANMGGIDFTVAFADSTDNASTSTGVGVSYGMGARC